MMLEWYWTWWKGAFLGEEGIWATKNRSKKSRCENKSSAIVTSCPEITSWKELKELSTDLNKVCKSFQIP